MPSEPTRIEEGANHTTQHFSSLYRRRGTHHVGARDPETCITATIETTDDDRASSMLGVLAPS